MGTDCILVEECFSLLLVGAPIMGARTDPGAAPWRHMGPKRHERLTALNHNWLGLVGGKMLRGDLTLGELRIGMGVPRFGRECTQLVHCSILWGNIVVRPLGLCIHGLIV